MDNRAVGLLDSGVGGFTVLKEVQDHLPQENYIYLGDTKRMPYGERTNEEIIEFVNSDIRFLEEKGAKLIILACNTASSLIEKLTSNVPLFSIVEAGCQAVLDYQQSGPVGLIATRATVKNQAYERTIPKYAPQVTFIAYGTPTLAQVINNQLGEIEVLRANIRQAINPILEQCPIKNLILGCTHYPIVKQTIREMYPELWLINPALKEIDIVSAYMDAHGMRRAQSGPGSTTVYITGTEQNLEDSRNMLKELEIDYSALEIGKLDIDR